jgi:hypothetical protein
MFGAAFCIHENRILSWTFRFLRNLLREDQVANPEPSAKASGNLTVQRSDALFRKPFFCLRLAKHLKSYYQKTCKFALQFEDHDRSQ